MAIGNKWDALPVQFLHFLAAVTPVARDAFPLVMRVALGRPRWGERGRGKAAKAKSEAKWRREESSFEGAPQGEPV
jgi:hypothetical protein